MSYHDACPSVLHSGQRAVGGSAYSPTIITGSIDRAGGAGPAAGVPSILQHQPVAPPGGADAEHLMRSNQGGFWWFWWSVVCNARDSDTCPIPPRRWRESGSSVTSRSGDVWPAFTTSCAAATPAASRDRLYNCSEDPSTRRACPPRHLLAIRHAADTDTYIDTAHCSLPRYLTAADARWNKAKKRKSASKDKFTTQQVLFQGTVQLILLSQYLTEYA